MKSPGASQKVIQQLEDQLSQKERLMTETTRTWMDRLKITEQRKLEEINYLRSVGISLGVENTLPNLVNLNEDPQVRLHLQMVQEDCSTGWLDLFTILLCFLFTFQFLRDFIYTLSGLKYLRITNLKCITCVIY